MLGNPTKCIDGRYRVDVFDGGELAATIYSTTKDFAILDARRYERSRGMEDAITDALDLLRTVGRVDRSSLVHNELSFALKGIFYDEDGEGTPDNVFMFTRGTP